MNEYLKYCGVDLKIKKRVIYLEDMSKILDNVFLSSMVGWSNYGDPVIVFHNKQVNKWFYFNDETNEIKEFAFNEVVCFGDHGFGGTQYTFSFLLNGNYIEIGFSKFAPTIEKLKEIKIKEINDEIKYINSLVKKKEELLNKINLILDL